MFAPDPEPSVPPPSNAAALVVHASYLSAKIKVPPAFLAMLEPCMPSAHFVVIAEKAFRVLVMCGVRMQLWPDLCISAALGQTARLQVLVYVAYNLVRCGRAFGSHRNQIVHIHACAHAVMCTPYFVHTLLCAHTLMLKLVCARTCTHAHIQTSTHKKTNINKQMKCMHILPPPGCGAATVAGHSPDPC